MRALLSSKENIWKQIEARFAEISIAELQAFVVEARDHGFHLRNLAVLSQSFSDLHCRQGDTVKAIGYSLFAIFCHLECKELSEAKSVLNWATRCIGRHEEFESVRNLIRTLEPSHPPLSRSEKTPIRSFREVLEFSQSQSHVPENVLSDAKAFLFHQELLNSVMKKGNLREFAPGSILFREGDLPGAFYIVIDGIVDLVCSQGIKKTFSIGEFFGEVSLLGHIRRTATLICRTHCKILELSTKDFDDLLRTNDEFEDRVLRSYENRLFETVAMESNFFGQKAIAEIDKFFRFFRPVHLPARAALFEEGQESNALFLILKGLVDIQQNRRRIAKRGPGELIGEIGLVYSVPRTASVIAATDTLLLECNHSRFKELCQLVPEFAAAVRDLARKRAPTLSHQKNVQ